MRGQAKFLSVLTITALVLSQSLVFAQEVTPFETPESTTEISTPTPTDDPSYNEVSENNSISDENQDSLNGNPDSAEEPDNSDVIASYSATIDVSLENNNDADVSKNVEVINDTGSNKAIENIDINTELVIKSGDAIAQENHSNIINTNIIGEYIVPAIVNFFSSDGDNYDYSNISPCVSFDPILSSDVQLLEAYGNNINLTDIYQREDSLGITNNNNANVVNNISVDALTGDNQSLDNIARSSIDTGDALIDVNIFNMLNTNLIGECGFFGIFNFFSPQQHSLILPSEKAFIENVSKPSTLSSLSIVNTNNAEANTDVTTNTNTGENELSDSLNFNRPPGIYTGDASTNQEVLDLTNLNFTLDNFVFLRIQHFGNWTGNLVGWDGLVLFGDDYILLAKNNMPVPDFSEDEIIVTQNGDNIEANFLNSELSQTTNQADRNVVIKNNNNAYLDNLLDLFADTGHNKANGINAEIRTGDALIDTDIFNLINTNIVGRNWFFGVINIFDTFSGDIIFPRADVAVDITSDKATVQSEDTFTYRINYSNVGQLQAENVSLVAVLPSDVSVVGISKQAVKSGQSLSWSLGNLQKQAEGSIYIQVKAHASQTSHPLLSTAVIQTSSYETSTNNNADQDSVLYNGSNQAQTSSSTNTSSTYATTTTSSTSSNTTPTPTPTIILNSQTIKPAKPFLPYQQYVSGASSDEDEEEDFTKTTMYVAPSKGEIGLDGIFKTRASWGSLGIAYLLGVLTTLIGLRIKRIFFS